ncbi:MAG: ECF transporter S component [Acidaminobacteraceae bacterium]
MKKISVSQIAMCGVMAALVAIGTSVIRVPINVTGGYVHLGDSLVYISGILFGPIFGGISAALGSFIADMLGYPLYAVPTFIIKGLDAFVVGAIYMKTGAKTNNMTKKIISYIVAFLAGGVVMVSGYYIFESYMYGFQTAILAVIPNVIQAVVGGLLGLPLFLAMERSGMMKTLKKSFVSK